MKKIENLYKMDILAVKPKESEDVLKKAIQMVIINNAMSSPVYISGIVLASDSAIPPYDTDTD